MFRSWSEHVHVAFDIILLLFFLQVEFIYCVTLAKRRTSSGPSLSVNPQYFLSAWFVQSVAPNIYIYIYLTPVKTQLLQYNLTRGFNKILSF